MGGLWVHRSTTLEGMCFELRGIPITTAARTITDLAAQRISRAELARAVREAVRIGVATLAEIADCVGRHPRRRGGRHVMRALARYSGLPLERARSGAEVRALEILRDADRPLPRLNVRIAGEEADLSWARERLIVEIDGAPFHQDVGEDARKEARWRAAGWEVRRLDARLVHEDPETLLALAPA